MCLNSCRIGALYHAKQSSLSAKLLEKSSSWVDFLESHVFARASTVQFFPDNSALYLLHLRVMSWDFLCCYTVPKMEGHLPLQHCPNYTRLDRMAPAFRAAGRDLLRVPSCPLLPKHPLMDASAGRAGALQCPLVQAYSQEKYPLPSRDNDNSFLPSVSMGQILFEIHASRSAAI